MNIIEVIGGTAKERSLCLRAAEFAVHKLMPRMKTLDITIEIKNIYDTVDGYCLQVDNRTFEIEIQKGIDIDDMVTAVFHEIVHVKQGARKELVDTGFCTKTWCGVEYICITSTTKEYMAQPWEAEAYYLQEKLFMEYENGA